MKHISIDLETMGTSPESAIISIGAVEFEVSEEDHSFLLTLGRRFHVNVDLQSSIDHGLKIDASTVYWWLTSPKVSQAARDALVDKTIPLLPLDAALAELSVFFRETGAVNIWARGQDFDIGILRTAYAHCGLKHPWEYNAARDSRTLYEAVDFDQSSVASEGTAHNALSDALWEARAIGSAMIHQQKVHYDLARLQAKNSGVEEPSDEIIRHLIGGHGRPMPEGDAPVPDSIPLNNMV